MFVRKAQADKDAVRAFGVVDQSGRCRGGDCVRLDLGDGASDLIVGVVGDVDAHPLAGLVEHTAA